MLCLPHSVLSRFPIQAYQSLHKERVQHAIFVKSYFENTLHKNLRFRI